MIQLTSALRSGRGSASHNVTEVGMSMEYEESHLGNSPSATSGMGQPSSTLLLPCQTTKNPQTVNSLFMSFLTHCEWVTFKTVI
jgi:hypothetical protein